LQALEVIAREMEAQEIQLRLDIAKYKSDADKVQRQAKVKEAEYNELNFHDDQFDLSDAALAVACAAVAALTESWMLLMAGWIFGAVGVAFGMAGFAGWQIHPDWLIAWLS
jgi:hypothetical protein